EHHPTVGHVAVAGQVDPAHPAMGEAANDLVLAGHQLVRAELGLERERGSALAAEARGPSRRIVASTTHRLIAARAEAAALGDERGGLVEDRVGRVAERHRRDLDQPGPEAPARARAGPTRRDTPARAA